MLFHEKRLLADDSHEISYLFFCKLGKMLQNMSSALVVIGALRVKKSIVKTMDLTPPDINFKIRIKTFVRHEPE